MTCGSMIWRKWSGAVWGRQALQVLVLEVRFKATLQDLAMLSMLVISMSCPEEGVWMLRLQAVLL